MKLSQADAPPPFQPGKPVGNVYYGACSWTARTLIDAGTFYPGNAWTTADRLAHYASQFPIVEVDATYYTLPSERNARLWVDRTPPGFVFNIKARPVHASSRRRRDGSGGCQGAVAGCLCRRRRASTCTRCGTKHAS